MKTCPRCHKELEDTAIRCRYCRRPFYTGKKKPLIPKSVNLEPGYPSWSPKEVLALWVLAFAANFALEHYEVTSVIMESLRRRYFILIKEPALQFHLYTFISAFILKLSAVAIIWMILKLHKTSFIEGLNLNKPIKKQWLWMFPAFFVFSAAVRLIGGIDPLSPNLPIYLFFKESSIIGTAFALFSISVVAPVSEEIFFRGFIYPGINKKLGLYWATLITSFLFMAVHIPQNREHPLVLLTILFGGLFLTLARALTKSTLIAVLLHLLYNSTLVGIGYVKFLIFKY